MSTSASLTIRPVTTADESRWRELFRSYREFYHLPESEDVVTRVWGWVTDPSHESESLIAEADGEVIAIADFRRFSRPSTGTTGIWLDDLFTAPEARGTGAGRALIARLQDIAAAEGRSVVRWITADDNLQAQFLYDRVATKTNWLTYDAAPRRS